LSRDRLQRVGGDATVPLRVDDGGALQVLADDRQTAERIQAENRSLVARINAELDHLKRGSYDQIASIHLHDAGRGALELARLTVDMQEHLRNAE